MECKKCKKTDVHKSGFMNKKQRYKCKRCGCHFTEGDGRGENGKSNFLKRVALIMYLEGNGFRAIERMIKDIFQENVSNVAVLKWIRKLGKEVEELRRKDAKNLSIVAMELDEMWHFIGKKNKNCGSGLHLIENDTNPLLSFWDVEGRKQEKNSGKKSKK